MTQRKNNVIAIVGTTGVGKSQFSIDLAQAINGEIINADSMQVYKGLDNITNKHPMDERNGVPHHVMDYVGWDEEYFIHKFSEDAGAAIDDIHRRGKVPIIIGGTHYYLLNLLFNNKTIGQNEGTSSKSTLALTSDQLQILDGPVETIFETLKQLDPVIAEKFHPNDKRKLRRALEIYYTTGELPSAIYQNQKLDELDDTSLKFNTLLFWVYCDPEVLKPRLDSRVDKMMEMGATKEITDLFEEYNRQDPQPDCTSGIWQVIGFKEFLPWLKDGCKDSTLWSQGIERMKIRTRQYAKYQIKWIKKLLSVELQKESRFNFKYGGKLYLLDATDLSQWKDKVSTIGIDIARQFINGGPKSVSHEQAPKELMSIFPTDDYVKDINSNKKIGSEANWKHYQCDVCRDKQNNPLIAVGEESWKTHVNSRRHKKLVQGIERKRKHEQMIEQWKKKL